MFLRMLWNLRNRLKLKRFENYELKQEILRVRKHLNDSRYGRWEQELKWEIDELKRTIFLQRITIEDSKKSLEGWREMHERDMVQAKDTLGKTVKAYEERLHEIQKNSP